MPFYSVQVHGEGICVPKPDGSAPIVGFYAVRFVWSRSEDQAKEKALRMVRGAWASGSHAQSNTGAAPVLFIESVQAIGVLSWARAPNTGHLFYPEEEHAV